MDLNIDDLEKAEKYIRGELNQNEIEALWVKFLQDQKLYRYFMMQVQIVGLIMDVNAVRAESPFEK